MIAQLCNQKLVYKVHGYMIVLHVSILDREKKTPEHRRGHKTNCEKPNALPLVLPVLPWSGFKSEPLNLGPASCGFRVSHAVRRQPWLTTRNNKLSCNSFSPLKELQTWSSRKVGEVAVYRTLYRKEYCLYALGSLQVCTVNIIPV